ncbi:MAG: sugar-binding transcriptional regulator [Anaerostipes sp.]|jgi:deoxyribonucleoside regulator
MVEDKKLLVDVAHLYYEKQLTQQQIAKQLNVSRSLISKMLVKARDNGIVEVIIHDDTVHVHRELEERMKHLFQLKDVICVEPIAGKTVEESVVSYACKYLESKFVKTNDVAVAGGRMMKEIAVTFSPKVAMEHITFIPLCGGIDEEFWNAQANTVCDYFASHCGGYSLQLHAPLILETTQARDMLLNQRFISNVIEKAKDAQLAVVGIGNAYSYARLEEHYLNASQKMTQEHKQQIKGDIIYHYYDKKGELIDCAWNHQTISLGFQELKKIPEVIGVAYELEKVESIYISIREKMINSLIIPATLAQQIIKMHLKFT